jgi:hypothetical protein
MKKTLRTRRLEELNWMEFKRQAVEGAERQHRGLGMPETKEAV